MWLVAAILVEIDAGGAARGTGAAGCREEIPHVQGQRNPSKIGAERRHQKADRQKPPSQKTNHLTKN